MRATCIVTHFNYGRFVVEACTSALAQVHPFDEILLVDDGSTDGSTDVLTTHYGSHDRVHLVLKPNGGQLSCFAEGFARATGDVVFFLDADDIYEPDYVAAGRLRRPWSRRVRAPRVPDDSAPDVAAGGHVRANRAAQKDPAVAEAGHRCVGSRSLRAQSRGKPIA
jgi:glycosyltransferase involved in cell wall biosynthesis